MDAMVVAACGNCGGSISRRCKADPLSLMQRNGKENRMSQTISLPIPQDAAKRAERRVFKYALEIMDYQPVDMPAGAEILCVHGQWGKPCIWALVNPNNQVETRRFRIVGTGHSAEDITFSGYIGTAQIVYPMDGPLVWHAFEVPA